ncbi:uncharacterized protein LOC141668059 isoform X2 [Apium graveolens]|uniref:uncharacterized protein LOC141668059 isoform X2 n=1 Tax=Apium graveolens TaxID=4045 RepID=UPI003D7A8B33
MIMSMMLTRSDVILRPQLFTTSPAKLYYPPARICFGRNTNTSVGLVLSVTPQKLNNLNYYYNASDSNLQLFNKKINKPFVVHNKHQSIINSSCDDKSNSNTSSSSSCVTNKLVEIKKTVVNTIASLLLFGFLAFMTSSAFRTPAFAASVPSLSSSVTPDSDCNEDCDKIDNISKPANELLEELWIQIITIILCVIFAPLTIPFFAAILVGYKYYLEICENTKEKSILMLQVGVLDGTRELQREVQKITQVASNLDGVVKSLLRCNDSCRFAHLSVTQCISDEKKYGNNFAEMMDSFDKDPEALVMLYDLFKYLAKSLAIFVHLALIKAIKKIYYDGKCSKQLFAEFLGRELAKYDEDEETLASVDGMQNEEEAVGRAHRMFDNDYLVVTILVLASGVYSIPPLQCNTEHVKTVLQKLSSIPKNKIESLQVLLTPQTEDEAISEKGLAAKFPLLKPLTLSCFEN